MKKSVQDFEIPGKFLYCYVTKTEVNARFSDVRFQRFQSRFRAKVGKVSQSEHPLKFSCIQEDSSNILVASTIVPHV